MQAGRSQVVSEHCRHTGCKLFRTPRHSQLSQRSTLQNLAQQSPSQPQQTRPAHLAAAASASDESGHSAPEPEHRQSFPAWSAAVLTAAVPVTGLVAAALPAHAECGNGGGSNHNGGDGGDGGGDGQSGSNGRSRQHLFDVADDDDDDEGGQNISCMACLSQVLQDVMRMTWIRCAHVNTTRGMSDLRSLRFQLVLLHTHCRAKEGRKGRPLASLQRRQCPSKLTEVLVSWRAFCAPLNLEFGMAQTGYIEGRALSR